MRTPPLPSDVQYAEDDMTNVPMELLHWWTTTIYCPMKYNYLKGKTLLEFKKAWKDVVPAAKKKILHFALKRWFEQRAIFLSDAPEPPTTEEIISKSVLQNTVANITTSDAKPGDPTFVYGLFNNTADEHDYHPSVWKIRTEYFEALERAGGADCPSCERNALLNKYNEKLNALIGGPSLT